MARRLKDLQLCVTWLVIKDKTLLLLYMTSVLSEYWRILVNLRLCVMQRRRTG